MPHRLIASPQIPETLKRLQYPLCFMDFESYNPALPQYRGTRPYQHIAFQWSVHILDEDGTLNHYDYLHDGQGDPRKPFAESLIQVLKGHGHVVVYSSFEKTRLNELCTDFPGFDPELRHIMERLFDLLPIMRSCRHPDFKGSYSLKSVLPALIPNLDYAGLEIQGGNNASSAYKELVSGCSEEEKTRIKAALRRYCCRDTQGLVELFLLLNSQSLYEPHRI